MGESLKFPDIMTQRIFSDLSRAGYFLADVEFCFVPQLLQGVSWIGVHSVDMLSSSWIASFLCMQNCLTGPSTNMGHPAACVTHLVCHHSFRS